MVRTWVSVRETVTMMVVMAAMVMLVVVKMMVMVVVMVILVMVVIMVKTCPHWLPYPHIPLFNIYSTGMLWLLHGGP